MHCLARNKLEKREHRERREILFGAITPIVKLTWSSRPIVISMSVISKIAGPTLFITQVLAFDKLAVLLL